MFENPEFMSFVVAPSLLFLLLLIGKIIATIFKVPFDK